MTQTLSTFAALTILLSTTAAPAFQTPFVVKRFGVPTAHSSDPSNFVALDGHALFRAETAATGRELWASDGTESGTRLVKDIVPGVEDPFGGESIAAAGLVFWDFLPWLGRSSLVWRTDGTPAGTFPVFTYTDGELGWRRAGDQLLFSRSLDSAGSRELWATDGTVAGTRKLADDFGPYFRSSEVVDADGSYIFAAGRPNPTHLWRSDFTPSGTFPVVEIQDLREFVELNGAAIFTTRPNLPGSMTSLWASDGTTDGTSVIAESLDQVNFSAAAGDIRFFVAFALDSGRELWRTDGTNAGTYLVKDIRPGPQGAFALGPLSNEIVLNGRLIFLANDGTHGEQLWSSDGTSEGTMLLSGDPPGASSLRIGPRLGDYVYFVRTSNGLTGLARTDGTPAGTTLVREFLLLEGELLDILLASNNRLLLRVNGGGHGIEPWVSDGTAAGTFELKDIAPGPASSLVCPDCGVAVGDKFYFPAYDGSDVEPWVSDGTPAGTLKLNIAPDTATSAPLSHLVDVGHSVYFVLDAGSPALWVTDGSTEGTQPLGYDAGESIRFDDSLFFSGAAPGEPTALGQLMRTAPGELPHLIKDIPHDPNGPNLREFTVSEGRLFFVADQAELGTGLWMSDGSDEGTNALMHLSPGTTIRDRIDLTDVDGTLYFKNPTSGELWRSDGTTEGTQVVAAAIRRGSSQQAWFTSADGVVLFVGSDSPEGFDLWRTDGTSAGTFGLKDIDIGRSQSPLLVAQSLVDLNGIVVFSADDGESGRELWRSDGTAAGTVMIKDIFPGAPSGMLEVDFDGVRRRLFTMNGLVLFAADDGVAGMELWRSDGTETGTFLLRDIAPGLESSKPESFVYAGGRAFFQACDAAGCELWQTDGTEAETQRVADVLPGPLPSNPRDFTLAGSLLFFTAFENASSRELWALPINEDTPTPGSPPPTRSPTPTRDLTTSPTRTATISPTLAPTATSSPTATVTPTRTTMPSPRITPGVVRIAVGDGVPEADVPVEIGVYLYSGGVSVGGVDHSIAFDTTAVTLDAPDDCAINPDVGVPGDPSTCDDRPCKSLIATLRSCASDPRPSGCPPEAGQQWSVLRAVIASAVVPSNNAIPDVSLLYTCRFRVVEPDRLPACLLTTSVLAGSPFGEPIAADATSGTIYGGSSSACRGDCDDSGDVTVDEIVQLIGIALGHGSAENCSAGDGDGNGAITVDEIVAAIFRALNGCDDRARCGVSAPSL